MDFFNGLKYIHRYRNQAFEKSSIYLIHRKLNKVRSESETFSILDKDDIRILKFVITAKPDVFVTGDKGILKLGNIKGIPVLSSRRLWLQLAGLEG